MVWISVLALIAVVVLIRVIVLALKAELKGKQAHTDVRPSQRRSSPATRSLAPPPTTLDPPEPIASPSAQSPMVEPAEAPSAESANISEPAAASATPPQGKIRAWVTYRKTNGACSEREVVIYSRVMKEGQLYAVNIRESGDGVPKKFLVTGLERLQLLDATPETILDSPAEIRRWIEANLPLKSERRVATKSRRASGPQPAQIRDSAAAVESQPAVAPVAQPLPMLLPEGAKGFAVIDLETTGFGALHRIVEVAVIRLDPDGRLKDEWDSLLNPGMPIPRGAAQSKHRIQDRMVQSAPTFEALASALAQRLHGYVLVAHNLPFDQEFLERSFSSVQGIGIHLGSGLNTMKSNKSLASLCQRLGVYLSPEEAHCALVDARALSMALVEGISHLEPADSAVLVERNIDASRDCQSLARSVVQRTLEVADRSQAWTRRIISLVDGAEFVKTDVPDALAEALAERLGLVYRRVKKVPLRRPATFLLAETLGSTTAKMRQAKQQGLPVLLFSDAADLAKGAEAVCWVFDPSKAFSAFQATVS